jgi:predicted ribosome quality control (RQC) complex YloA/Tae2 family protein
LARIAGVNLPNQKRLEIGLTYIYGIGQPTAQKICLDTGLSPDEKVKDLTDEEVTNLRVGRETEGCADLLRRRLADAEDVGQPDLEPLLVRQVHACYTSHLPPLHSNILNLGAACGADSCK